MKTVTIKNKNTGKTVKIVQKKKPSYRRPGRLA